jgi:hypothetical protein
LEKNERVVLSHHGRWHIATKTMEHEKVKENLQYRNFDSNQSVQRLYFACINNDSLDKCLYGLERNMDGIDSWDKDEYKLSAEQYTVRITLRGNNGLSQEFMYKVKNNNGKISIVEALTNESRKELF